MPGPLLRVLRRRRAAGPDGPEPAPAAPPADQSPPTTESTAVAPAGETAEAPSAPWLQRGRLRRRLRFVRRARELALRDLGGLVFELHRFGRERPDLIAAKMEALAALDRERLTLEQALDDHREFDVLREPGLASCPRCGVLHPSEARFCSHCGLPLAAGAALPPDHPDPARGETSPPPAAAPATDAPAPEAVPGGSTGPSDPVGVGADGPRHDG